MDKIEERVIKVYKKRQEAHNILLECDIEINEIIKELYAQKKRRTLDVDNRTGNR